MIDDILVQIFGEVALSRVGGSRRAQLLFRLFFGLLGAALGLVGAVYFVVRPATTSNIAMHASMVAVFLFLSCFCFFNVALARAWRWPGFMLVLCFVLLFVTRIAFGR